MPPRTSYARSGDTKIAYQVFGEGDIDLLISPGFISHLEMWWMIPEATHFLRRLGSFARVIAFDKRGTGLSDPCAGVPTIDERMQDLHAVLDAAGAERAAIFGYSEGGPSALLYAAMYPERVRALALNGTFARMANNADYARELGWTLEEAEERNRAIRDHLQHALDDWGSGKSIDVFAPSVAPEPSIRRAWAMFERMAASPTMAQAVLDSTLEIDITRVLPVISVPTQVSHRRSDPAIPVELGRYLAEHIPNAEYIELDGSDHPPWLSDADGLADELERFFTGARTEAPAERVLTTVAFTDIVSSTEKAAELGDRRWREVLERHDEFAAREVAAVGGVLVKSTGDGVLARFDGPGRAIEAAHRIVSEAPEAVGVDVRAGLHTGECEKRGDDLGGLAVHIGARIGAMAGPGEVLVSRAVRDLVIGTPLAFTDRGTHSLKGVPGEWQILEVEPVRDRRSGRPEPSYEIAPNAELATAGDRAVARLARSAPALGRALNTVAGARARRRSQERQGGREGRQRG